MTSIFAGGIICWLARVAKLADARVSKTRSFGSAGSSPAPGTRLRKEPFLVFGVVIGHFSHQVQRGFDAAVKIAQVEVFVGGV